MTCEEKLAQARDAYHSLVIGGQVRVFVDQNGERIEYTAANASRLWAYLQSLEAECGTLCKRAMRPLRPWF